MVPPCIIRKSYRSAHGVLHAARLSAADMTVYRRVCVSVA